jgi:hypothetical protein
MVAKWSQFIAISEVAVEDATHHAESGEVPPTICRQDNADGMSRQIVLLRQMREQRFVPVEEARDG